MSRSESIKNWVEIVVLISATIFGLYKFVFEVYIKPWYEPPYMIMTSAIRKMAEEDGLIAVEADINIRNASKCRVFVVASWFNAVGCQIESRDLNDAEYKKMVEASIKSNKLGRHNRSMVPSRLEVIDVGELWQSYCWFEPGEMASKKITIYLSEKYDLIRLNANMVFAKEKEKLTAKWKTDEHGLVTADIYSDTQLLGEPQTEEVETKHGLVYTNSISSLAL